ncbi:MAG: hypothetical protein IPN33_02375 [Saprospiraceae bacterium]|nr:hypothetical protein [Saprospiraceae bacterium]
MPEAGATNEKPDASAQQWLARHQRPVEISTVVFSISAGAVNGYRQRLHTQVVGRGRDDGAFYLRTKVASTVAKAPLTLSNKAALLQALQSGVCHRIRIQLLQSGCRSPVV